MKIIATAHSVDFKCFFTRATLAYRNTDMPSNFRFMMMSILSILLQDVKSKKYLVIIDEKNAIIGKYLPIMNKNMILINFQNKYLT